MQVNITTKVKNKILEKYIFAETAKKGDRLPAIRQLAVEFNVSAPTICKAIEALSAEGRVVKRLGSGVYLADPEQMPTFTHGGKKIGIVVHSMTETLGHRVIEAAENVARRNGYAFELASSNYDYAAESQCVDDMVRRGVSGILIYPVAKRDSENEYLAKIKLPLLVVDLYQEPMQKSRVIFDNYSAAYGMAEFLYDHGRKDILFLSYSHEYRHHAVEERLKGFRRAVEDEGIEVNEQRIYECGIFLSEKDSNLTDLLKYLDTLYAHIETASDAIICPTDFMAAAVIAHLSRRNISVPEQVCVTGFDNTYFDDKLGSFHGLMTKWPTTNPNFQRMGEVAAELLIAQIESKKSNTLVEKILPCTLLIPPEYTARLEPSLK